MYINTQPLNTLTHAGAPEISMQREMESQPLKLEPYQIVRATVAEGGTEKVILDLKHQQIAAQTKVPLRSGQNLSLEVLATQPQIHFKIIEKNDLNYLSKLLHSLGRNIKLLPLIEQIIAGPAKGFENFSKEMQAFLSVLAILLQSNPEKLSGKDLSRLWDRLDLNLEALLAAGKTVEAKKNIKAMLLMHAKEMLKHGENTEVIEKTIDQFRLFQLCRYSLNKDNILFLPLPFSFLEQGYLLAEKLRDQEHKSGQSWKMSLYLNLSFLGNLQILLLFENLTLRLRILCDSKDKADVISESLIRLQENLSTVSLHSFSVGIGAEDPIKSLVQRLAPDGDHFIKAEA
jgi:hypothetical protein